MTPHSFHPSILREYDIRGIVGETLSADDARAIGQGFGTIALRRAGKKIVVGYDGRLSSPDLEAALVEGLKSTGCEITRIGRGPTPMLYFASQHLNADGGIQVTGSHNPPSHNGFKIVLQNRSFFGEAIAELGRIVESGSTVRGEGSEQTRDVFDQYVERLIQDFHGTRSIDVVWDAGNGAAGPAMVKIAERIPGQSKCLFADIDGRFPNHHPDPTVPENLQDLINAVVDGGYEVGIGFDGDGDRIGVVDQHGRIIWGDQILQILASDVLKRHQGATIIADVKSSQLLFDDIARLGGKPLMWKTGHSLIKEKMIETSAPLSGEMSGHIFYKDGFYGHDDALYVAIRLLDILARDNKTLAEWRDGIPKTFNTPEIRFDCDEATKFEVIRKIADDVARSGADVDSVDGVRVQTEDGWWLLRASNTQAVLVARAEASSEAALDTLKEEIRRVLKKAGIEAPTF